MTVLVGGKTPREPINAVAGPIPSSVNEMWGQVYECFNRLFYDGAKLREWEAELERLERWIASRKVKLNNPELNDHPGRQKAIREYSNWIVESINLRGQIANCIYDLRAEALHVDTLWKQLPPEVQREIVESCKRYAPDIREIVLNLPPFTNGLGAVTNLKAWRELLPTWGSKYQAVPF